MSSELVPQCVDRALVSAVYRRLSKTVYFKGLLLMRTLGFFVSLIFISVSVANGDVMTTIETSKGKIEINLFDDKTPVTVANFVNLAKRGYYNGLNFHRVIPDFMVQGGDPDGTGSGGPGYNFEDEFDSSLKHSKPGILSMANRGPATNGSQFFITHVPTPWLDGKHTVFGEVVSGQDVIDSIAQGDQIVKVTVSGDAEQLLESQKSKIDEWNSVLDKKYPVKD